jgi:hypothetical protein
MQLYETCRYCGALQLRRDTRAIAGVRVGDLDSHFACVNRADCDLRQHRSFHLRSHAPRAGCPFCDFGLSATPTVRRVLPPLAHECAVQIQCWFCEEFRCESEIVRQPLFGADEHLIPMCADGIPCFVRTHRRHHTPHFAVDGLFVNGFNINCTLCVGGADIITSDFYAHNRYVQRLARLGRALTDAETDS